MQKICKCFSIGLLFFLALSCKRGTGENTGNFNPDAGNIQVVLFHLPQRCASCDAVETETRKVLNLYFREDVEMGKISFVSMSFRDRKGREAARMLGASGQALLVVSPDTTVDLTVDGFMHAGTHPERFRDTLRKELKKMRIENAGISQ